MGIPSSRPIAARPEPCSPKVRRTPRAKRLRPRVSGSPHDPRGEILAFRAQLLMQVPAPPRLTLDVPGLAESVEIAAVPPSADAREPGIVYFDADEWTALVLAVEADRVWPSDFRAICELKQTERDWTLTRARALSGGQPDALETWSVGEVIERLGSRLRSLSLDDLTV